MGQSSFYHATVALFLQIEICNLDRTKSSSLATSSYEKVIFAKNWVTRSLISPHRLLCCPTLANWKQLTYHPNLSYWCFHISPNVLFFQAKFYAETFILLRDMIGKTSWYSIDVSVNDRHILLFYEKCHFCHLLPFAKVGQYGSLLFVGNTEQLSGKARLILQ